MEGRGGNKHELANAIFTKSKQPFLELISDARDEQLADYQKGPWYSGNEVDELTIIEAGRMADQMTSWIDGEPEFSEKDKTQLYKALKNISRSLYLQSKTPPSLTKPAIGVNGKRI